MVNNINNFDFWNMPAEKYWAPTKNLNIQTLVNNAVYSGDYFAARKVDGHWYMMIKDMEGNIGFRGRSETVNGDFTDKIEWVPHLKTLFNEFPCGTVLIGELYFKGDEGSRKVTTIMGCLVDKAIARQEKGNKLSFYVFDVLSFNGELLLDTPINQRVERFNKENVLFNDKGNISFAQYYEGDVLMDYIAWVRANKYEGVVLQRKDGTYEPGKRPARKSIKVKKELDNEVDCFLTGKYKEATWAYTGKELQDWKYWFNVKTNEKLFGSYYDDYTSGQPVEAITKGAYFGWAGAIELGVCDGDNIVRVAWISNITEEIKQGIVSEPEKWKYKVVKINAMEREKDTGCFRHSKIMEWREDISWKDCTLEKVGK